MVMMWQAFSSLILLTKAASVEDLPLPVGPVTRTMPGPSSAASASWGGKIERLEIGHACWRSRASRWRSFRAA